MPVVLPVLIAIDDEVAREAESVNSAERAARAARPVARAAAANGFFHAGAARATAAF